ncbi:carbohydrate ABC transporter permease [Streptococcus gallinaceus]|uniref:Aldouronate transport system permease protein n=1 Tax=Streptococcus gallinaceus TaxID=165758 RepID=A0ABV2JM32_9STRE|nr:carbohydrate ABC transporter permease [Streptococcus gallinaceus]MCP1639846.1 putative aldouronate transport system permease protein [Streptococcus gallinaceus]MCP1770782.1 putative aldouronate transport system permease protein [Streptococcus gallinaceus]
MEKKKKVKKVNVRTFDKRTDFIFNVLIALFSLSCIIPFVFVIIISLTDENYLLEHGYSFFPKLMSLHAYHYVFEGAMAQRIMRSFGVSIFVTVVGTIINTTMTSTYAYAISRPYFPYRRFFTIYALITMLFSSGMVANYLVVTNLLQLKDSIWALILPMALGPFGIMIMRTFFKKTVPDSIIESARIDGASEFKVFVKIVLPLAVPGIATISLFSALSYWNDWFQALLYIQNDALFPMQFLLMKIQNNLQALAENVGMSAQVSEGLASLPKESVRMAIVVIATLPIAVTYPFFQKHFVGGLTIGGVKE